MNGLKYWDPEESTRTKWETTYASELQSRGLSQDFTGLSTLLLGQAQPAQFQSADQTGYWWGSKCTAVGVCDSTATVSSNALAGMIPREYFRGQSKFGGYYNWISATAESGNWDTPAETTIDDSLCPAGWKLPIGSNQADKSWGNLILGAYETSNATAAASIIGLSTPISLIFAADYDFQLGAIRNTNYGFYWSSTKGNESHVSHRNHLRPGYSTPNNTDDILYGFSVRCVKK